MIKGVLTSDVQGTTLFLGLSRMNVERLMAGMPILFRTDELHHPEPFDQVCIAFGETEQAILDELQRDGGPMILVEMGKPE